MLTSLTQEDSIYYILVLTMNLDNYWSEATSNHFEAALSIPVCLVLVVQCRQQGHLYIEDGAALPSSVRRYDSMKKNTGMGRLIPVGDSVGDLASLFCLLHD